MKIDRSEPQIIAYDADVYSAFPDVVFFKNEFICVYRESDCHHPTTSALIILRSEDGVEWIKELFDTADLAQEGYVFNCPRLSIVGGRLALVCDTKTSQQESECEWGMRLWWSQDGHIWSDVYNMGIAGLVPDKIIDCEKRLLMGYHIVEQNKRDRLVQMVAASTDDGLTWRDRTTVAVSDKNDFCEGSIVKLDKKKLLCYLRDNRGPLLRSQFVASADGGLSWSLPSKLDFMGHRIVAAIKEKEPYKGLVVATFRNTFNKNVTLILHNLKRLRTQMAHLDHESRDSMYDFGYTGWAEDKDGNLLVVYYIQRHRPKPMICCTRVILR